MIPIKRKMYRIGVSICVLAIIATPLFTHLGLLPLQLWDESRLAVSSLEMFSRKGNILVTTVDYIPDMWSTKPPFLIWCQVLFLHIFGINEFAVRLPSALAAFATCIFIYWFLYRRYKLHLPGILAALILVTTQGYVMLHGTRSADYDSMLVLFLTLYAGYFYLFIETKDRRYLHLTALFVILAVLTKGIAGGFFVPALIFYTLYRRMLKSMVLIPSFWFCTFTFLLVIAGYYLLREQYTPGYIAAVWENELGGRFLRANDGNVGGLLFFARNMVTKEYVYWCPFLILSFCALPFFKLDTLYFFVTLVFATFFLLLTASVTKLTWYSMPLYPFAAMAIAIFLLKLYLFVCPRLKLSYTKESLMITAVVLIICGYPYSQILYKSLHPYSEVRDNKDANELAMLLKQKLNNRDYIPLKVVWNEYQAPLSWYLKVANLSKYPIAKVQMSNLQPLDIVAAYENEVIEEIKARYTIKVLRELEYVKVFLIQQ